MTKAFAIPVQDERTPPPWLVGAFIVLFGVALAAAMPSIAAAAGSRAEAVNAHSLAGERIVVRAKVQILRVILPATSGGTDIVQAFENTAPVAPPMGRIAPRLVDLSTLSAERGIKIRAPPGSFA